MKITLDRVNDAVHLVARNADGNTVDFDGSPGIGGLGLGARPMEVVLMALGGCSSMDVLSILQKMRLQPVKYSMEIDGTREADAVPALFTEIHVIYRLEGELPPDKVLKAAALSMDTYCSVTRILEKTATITYSVFINGEKVR